MSRLTTFISRYLLSSAIRFISSVSTRPNYREIIFFEKIYYKVERVQRFTRHIDNIAIALVHQNSIFVVPGSRID